MRSGLAPNLHGLVAGEAGMVDASKMAAAAEAGDLAIRDAIVRAARWIGIGVANVVNMLHPDLVVLAGGVADIGQLLFDGVRSEVSKRVRMFPVDAVRIEPSSLGGQAGLYGGIAYALEQDRSRGEQEKAYGL